MVDPRELMREATIMHQCMLALSEAGCVVFRANVGKGWQGDILSRGLCLVLSNPRPFSTGLPPGFSDLFGFRPDGRAFFVEVKTDAGRLTAAQQSFLTAMQSRGAVAVVARSADTVVSQVMR